MINTITIQSNPAINFHVNKAGDGNQYLVSSVVNKADAFDSAYLIYNQIAEFLNESGMEIVQERMFGSLSVEKRVLVARAQALVKHGISPTGPYTYIQGNPTWGEGFSGVIIRAVCGITPSDLIWTIKENAKLCGKGWQHRGTSYFILQNIQGLLFDQIEEIDNSMQARFMLERARRIIRKQAGHYRDVIRTWIYHSDLPDWYKEFNQVRNDKYAEFAIMPGIDKSELLLPAITSVNGDNPQGAASAMDLFAVGGPIELRPSIKQLMNPDQNESPDFTSSFSRGTVIYEKDMTLLQLSGTTAINNQGDNEYIGDLHGQIECTLGKITTLLAQEGATLHDMCAATVFFKRGADAQVFWEITREYGLVNFPCVCIIADFYSDDLLFEMDGELAFGKALTKDS